MAFQRMLVFLVLILGATIQPLDAQIVYLEAFSLPPAADYIYVTYFAERVNTSAVGTFFLPLCSPYENGSFVEMKRQGLSIAYRAPILLPNSNLQLPWNFTGFPVMTPRLSGVYRCYTSTAQSGGTYTLHVLVEPSLTCPQNLSFGYNGQKRITCMVRGYPQPNVTWTGHGNGNVTNTPPSLVDGVSKFNSTLKISVSSNMAAGVQMDVNLTAQLPAYSCTPGMDSSVEAMCQNVARSATRMLAVTISGTPNCSGVMMDFQFQVLNRTYLASGQETEALKTHNVLPYCRKKPFGRCIGKTIHLTLRHTDEPQFNFTDPNVSNDVTWNSTRFPRLEPFHSGEYVCEADHEQFDTKYNLQVVVPSRTDCQLRQDLVKKVVSVNCTVYGNPAPKARWEGKDVNFTDSQPSYRNGVHEYNSTAVFPLPGIWTYNSSVSVSIEVYHDPPVDCTAVIGDLSIQQRCNDTSSNISTTFAISPGKITMESRGIYDGLTQVTYLDPRVYGEQINNCGETSSSKHTVIIATVSSFLAYVLGGISMCVVRSCWDMRMRNTGRK